MDSQQEEEDKAAAVEGKEPEHRMLPPVSRGWAYGGRDGSRKDEVDSQQQEENKAAAVEGKEPEHRMLPPMSRGWAYEGGSSGRSGRKEITAETLEGVSRVPDIAREQVVAAEGKEPEHRMLPPVSRGWAYGGRDGSRKDEVDSQEGEKAAAPAAEEGKPAN